MQKIEKPVRIMGVPMDLGASRRGTDMGPSALRIAGLAPGLESLGYQVLDQVQIAVPDRETAVQHDPTTRFKQEILTVCTALAREVEQAMHRGEYPLVLGGDHSIAMGSVAGVAAAVAGREQRIGLIWFDAHGDMNIPGRSPSGNVHGMPLAHLLGEGDTDLCAIQGISPKVHPENVALVGIRDIDDAERLAIRESGIHTFTMRDVDERGMRQVAEEIIEVVTRGTGGFHLSFDVDGCDPGLIPGSGTLVPGGVNFREAHLLLEMCADSQKMLSMDVVELNPVIDEGNISAERTVGLILSAFGKQIL
jgi:arginase